MSWSPWSESQSPCYSLAEIRWRLSPFGNLNDRWIMDEWSEHLYARAQSQELLVAAKHNDAVQRTCRIGTGHDRWRFSLDIARALSPQRYTVSFINIASFKHDRNRCCRLNSARRDPADSGPTSTPQHHPSDLPTTMVLPPSSCSRVSSLRLLTGTRTKSA